jgi:hypothetical protein
VTRHSHRIARERAIASAVESAMNRNCEFGPLQGILFRLKPKRYKRKILELEPIWQRSCPHGTQASCHIRNDNQRIFNDMKVNIIPIIRRKLS